MAKAGQVVSVLKLYRRGYIKQVAEGKGGWSEGI